MKKIIVLVVSLCLSVVNIVAQKPLSSADEKYIKTQEGKEVMFKLYHITDFKKASDADYDLVRGYLKDLGKTAQDFVK